MTREEFYSILSSIKDGWTVNEKLFSIRRKTTNLYQCPITAVCWETKKVNVSPTDWEDAVIMLDLPPYLSKLIKDAADGIKNKERKSLLETLRLEENRL